MKISIIIPTHNRSEQLKAVLKSIFKLNDKVSFEIIVVDNNSTDNTKAVCDFFKNIKYVFEKNTAFSKARNTGAVNSTGQILLYLDDDVLVNDGSLTSILKVFKENKKCGAIAGKILPKFLSKPPNWTLDCQKSFNGWSLYNNETYHFLKKDFQEVNSGAGPMIAIKKIAYDKVGGFPPDTVGIETNNQKNTFNKHYTGPGEYGLCHKLKKAGYKIYFKSDISVFHVISPVRFNISFWRSRMIGEGYQQAITDKKFYKLSKFHIYLKKSLYFYKYKSLLNILSKKLNNIDFQKYEGMHPEELWLHYYKAYLNIVSLFEKYKNLPDILWNMGLNGVSDQNFDKVVREFPVEYNFLSSRDFFYDDIQINNLNLNQLSNKNIFFIFSKKNQLIGFFINFFLKYKKFF